MSESQTNIIPKEKDFSFKDLVNLIKSHLTSIFQYWKWILLSGLVVALYMFYKAATTPITYSAKLTFMINEDEGSLGAGGGASGILGALGVGSTQKYNLDKILELSKSYRILCETLLEKNTVDGVDDYFANHLIKDQEMVKNEWKKDTSLNKGFKFSHGKIDSFSRKEFSALKSVYKKLLGSEKGKGMFLTTYSKASSIMELGLTTRSEELTINFLNAVYKNLGDFYVKKSIEKQQFTYEVIINKADSLKALLDNREFRKAKFFDTNHGLVSEISKVPERKLTRDVAILQTMYGEATKNAEVADFAIKSKIPFVQAIDLPIYPIEPKEESKINSFIVGFLIGSCLCILVFVFWNIYKVGISS